MPECDSKTHTMTISDVKNQFSRLVDQVSQAGSRILVEKSGIAVAAIVSVEDLQRLHEFERRREAFFSRIDRVQEAFKDVPPEEIEQETDRIIARNRAADRAAREELTAMR